MRAALLGLLLVSTVAAAPEPARPGSRVVEATGRAFDRPARLRVAGLSESEAELALAAGLDALARAEEALGEEGPRSLAARLEATPEAVPLDPPLVELLARAQEFCTWSRGAVGATGGRVRELWRRGAVPSPADLEEARASAGCETLGVDPEAGTARLAAGTRLDLHDFAAGWAVDRTVEALREAGVSTGLVEVGGVRRGFGDGPAGRGWRVLLPIPPGYTRPLGEVWLTDRSLAVARFDVDPLRVGGERLAPFLDLRTGRPVEGVVSTLAVTELALDAQGLAAAAFVLGVREGRFRIGLLAPPPSVRWLLGTGDGRPLLMEQNWSAVDSRQGG